MGFWRKEVIDHALDQETQQHIREQMEWIGREPANPRPYFHLAQLYRMQWRQQEALALLLEAVRLDDGFPDAHLALAEIYSVLGDYPSAWRHARAAELRGRTEAISLLERHGIPKS